MLFPITATMELFKSFETSFPVRYQNTVSKKLQMFQSVGPEGDSMCFSGSIIFRVDGIFPPTLF